MSKTAAKGRAAYQKETYIAAFAFIGILTHVVLRYGFGSPAGATVWPLLAVLIAGGAPLILDLLRKAIALEFGADLLAGIAIVTSAPLGEYLAGSIVVLMLAGGTALEQYATRRASAVLGALAKRMPSRAHRRTAAQIAEIDLAEVRVGDLLVVFPHEICPVDGKVVDGRGSMDESYLTGEPFQMLKVIGSEVLSGAVNGDAALTIEATKLALDSRYAKIMRVMQEAEANRPRFRRMAERLGAWYTAAAVAVAIAGWAMAGNPTRFLAVLVIATPCPLLLAIPVAIIGAISLAASRAIIIKNPAMLERIDTCRTVIFDKTGTLTYGKPTLSETLCANGTTATQALRMAASLERYSKHPLAKAVMDAAESEHLDFYMVGEVSEKPGEGLRGKVGDNEVQICGRNQLASRPDLERLLPEAAAGMECILLVNGTYSATLRFHDSPRKESRVFVNHLGPRHHVNRIMLLSGDRENEVRYLAREVGISEVLFGKSPEEKLAVVREESKRAPTLFLGDGINDAPAMRAATVSIAFGQNSDVTAEAADAVVLEASLSKVDELIHIGRRMRRLALESAMGGMGLSIVGMMLAMIGYLPPVAGAVAQEVIDALAVLNALRVALPSGDLRDRGI